MSKDKRINIEGLLDQIAADAMTRSAAELRAELEDAGVNPDSDRSRAKSIGRNVVERYWATRREALPDSVPEGPAAMQRLLDELLTFPGAPTVAFREQKDLSEHDLRILAENLLELAKKHGDT